MIVSQKTDQSPADLLAKQNGHCHPRLTETKKDIKELKLTELQGRQNIRQPEESP